MKKNILMPILAVILCAALLMGANTALAGIRQANTAEELNQLMLTMLPGSTGFVEEEYTGEDTSIRGVYKDSVGYVVHVVTYGYVGDITMLVAVNNDGEVMGLNVRDMSETIGLGAKALTDYEFLCQFLKTSGEAEIGSTVDALTGATVTSKAIARSVNSAVGFVTGSDVDSGATSWGG
jgi:electron transport complex protein RnfG